MQQSMFTARLARRFLPHQTYNRSVAHRSSGHEAIDGKRLA